MILKEVWNGWKNVVFPSEKIEKLANERFRICNNCETKSKRGFCNKSKGGCGCPLKALLRSEESKCKKGKW
jgi:hypothetical protein